MEPLVLLNMDLTYQCNLACEHCGSHGSSSAGCEESIATGDALRLIRESSELGCRDVTLAGGEPLLHEGIFAILDEIGKRRMRAGLLTNGTCLDADTVERLRRCAGVGYVRVSIGCVDSGLSDACDVRDDFETVSSAVSELVRAGIPTGLSMTATPSNLRAIPDVIELAVRLGVDFVRIVPVVPVGRAARWEIGEDFWAEVLRSTITTLARNGVVTSLEYERLPGSVREFAAAFAGPCVAGTLSCTVEPDGRAMPCPLMGEEPSLTVDWRNTPLAAVWGELRRRAAMSRETESTGSGRCADCSMSATCFGGCPAEQKARDVALREGQPICITSVVERACAGLFDDPGVRRIMSGMLARQSLNHAIGLSPCVRSSPLWLHPIVEIQRNTTA